jgi:hypothetical protein
MTMKRRLADSVMRLEEFRMSAIWEGLHKRHPMSVSENADTARRESSAHLAA